ncbi:MAG: CBS domain-containing protein [Chloroflexota bacterium]|nr:CBS domain-containing protein [Chloroflexota bacterium]
MICPVCGYENLQGEDNCQNCGTDLRTADVPAPGTRFEARLLRQPLAALDTTPVQTAAPSAPAAEAIARMQRDGAGALVVEQDGRVVGIFTEHDALQKVAGRSLDGLTIEQVMTRDPVMLRADDSVAVAIHKMAVGGFRHIPLVDGGRITAVVTARDLFRYILELLG